MGLEINYRKKTVKNTNTSWVNNMLVSKQRITHEIKEKMQKYLETQDNENTMFQYFSDIVKEVLRGKCISIQS